MRSIFIPLALVGVLAGCSQDTLDRSQGSVQPMASGGPQATPNGVVPAGGGTAPAAPTEAPSTPSATPSTGEQVDPNLGLGQPAAPAEQAPGSAAAAPDASAPVDPAAPVVTPEPVPEPPAALTPAELVGPLDGFLFTARCGDGGTGYDCLNSVNTCSDGQPTEFRRDFAVAGDPAKIYDVTVRVRGVVELKLYSNDVRAAGTASNADSEPNFFAAGGTIPTTTYNTYELNVTPNVPGAANHYWLNSRDDTNEDHESWPLNYEATFPVQGGGNVNYRVFDTNCRQIMNCGPGNGSSTCRQPRTVDLSNADPPVANFAQPFQGPAGAFGQWVHIDVVSVVAR